MHPVGLSWQSPDIQRLNTGREPDEASLPVRIFEHRIHRSEHVALTGFPEIYLIKTNLKI